MTDKIQMTEEAKDLIVEKIREAHRRVIDEIDKDALVDMWNSFTRQQLIALSHGIAFHIRTDLCTPDPVMYAREQVAGVAAEYLFYDEDLRSIVPRDPFLEMSAEAHERYIKDALVMVKTPDPNDYTEKGILLLPDMKEVESCHDEVTCPGCNQTVMIRTDITVECPFCQTELKTND